MKKCRIILSLLIACLLAAAVAAQPRRPGTPRVPPPPDKASAVPDDDDPLSAFPEKGLPDSYILGSQPSPELARMVAERILKNDADSLPFLIAALQKAGFHIMDANQKILFRPTSTPIGAAFYDFEVAGMLRATGFGAVTTVEKLGTRIANGDPDLTRARFPELLLKDIRTSLRSSDLQSQFIGTLIVELGKKTADLRTAAPAQARINLIQASLIERVFLGDMVDAFDSFSEQNASLPRVRGVFETGTPVRFAAAAWNFMAATTCDDIADVSKAVGIEGKIKKVAGKVFDKESIPSILTGPKEAIKKHFENVAKGIEGANIIMSYLKVVLANMNLKADITVEDPMPLIRTKLNTEYAEYRTVTAKFRIDFKHADTINCVGKAVKASTGLEVEVPKDGPLKGVPVKWEPIMEGTGYSKFGGYPVVIRSEDKNRGDISKQVTDDLGQNKITLYGKPQDRNLQNEPVVPQAKRARLNVSIATENMDASEDLPKIFWFGFEGDFGLKAFIELAPDILAKMALKTFKVNVPVRDWQPCSEDWGGYINYSKTSSSTIVVKSNRTSNGNSTGDGIRKIVREEYVNVVLNPRTPEQILAKADPRPADFRVHGRYSDIFEGSREADPCCGPASGNYSTKFRSGQETTFLGSFRQRFYLSFSGGDRDYSLGMSFSTDPVDGREHSFYEVLSTNCPLEYAEENSQDSETKVMVTDSLPDGRYGDRFVNSEGDLLQGTKVIPGPGGATVTWEWALARCGRSR